MIPKIIHYCWLSDDPYPTKIKNCIESWKKFLPDYEFVHWDREKLYSINSSWAIEAFENKKYAFAADFIRCYSVYNFGGIYLDTDVEVCQSLNDLLQSKSFMGVDSKGDIEAAVFGAEPNVEWIKFALDFYKGRHFINEDGSFNIVTMPNVFKNALTRSLSKNPLPVHKIIELDNITLYPYDYFSPKDYTTSEIIITEQTYTIHHFTASWKNEIMMKREKSWWWKTIIIPLSKVSNCLEAIGGDRYRRLKTRLWSKRIMR